MTFNDTANNPTPLAKYSPVRELSPVPVTLKHFYEYTRPHRLLAMHELYRTQIAAVLYPNGPHRMMFQHASRVSLASDPFSLPKISCKTPFAFPLYVYNQIHDRLCIAKLRVEQYDFQPAQNGRKRLAKPDNALGTPPSLGIGFHFGRLLFSFGGRLFWFMFLDLLFALDLFGVSFGFAIVRDAVINGGLKPPLFFDVLDALDKDIAHEEVAGINGMHVVLADMLRLDAVRETLVAVHLGQHDGPALADQIRRHLPDLGVC